MDIVDSIQDVVEQTAMLNGIRPLSLSGALEDREAGSASSDRSASSFSNANSNCDNESIVIF